MNNTNEIGSNVQSAIKGKQSNSFFNTSAGNNNNNINQMMLNQNDCTTIKGGMNNANNSG